MVVVSLSSPVLLWLRLAFHCCEKGGSQLALFSNLEAGVAHLDVNDGEILPKNVDAINTLCDLG